MDCVTTVIGISYTGAKEMNPFMAGIVNSNLDVFLIVKTAGTVFIAATYIFARQFLMQVPNKTSRTFSYYSKFLTVAYVGIVGFLAITVANNLFILLT